MRKTTIDRLCDEINALNGKCEYPQIGHLRYANIAGDGRRHRTVYAIINPLGGVRAVHNGATPRQTATKLRAIRDYFLNKVKP